MAGIRRDRDITPVLRLLLEFTDSNGHRRTRTSSELRNALFRECGRCLMGPLGLRCACMRTTPCECVVSSESGWETRSSKAAKGSVSTDPGLERIRTWMEDLKVHAGIRITREGEPFGFTYRLEEPPEPTDVGRAVALGPLEEQLLEVALEPRSAEAHLQRTWAAALETAANPGTSMRALISARMHDCQIQSANHVHRNVVRKRGSGERLRVEPVDVCWDNGIWRAALRLIDEDGRPKGSPFSRAFGDARNDPVTQWIERAEEPPYPRPGVGIPIRQWATP